MPFRPGGLEDILVDDLNQNASLTNEGLKNIPPGFARGLRLPNDPIENDETFSLGIDDSYIPEEQGMVSEYTHTFIVNPDNHFNFRTRTDWYHLTKTTVILWTTARILMICYQHQYGR
jgi:hypothetical protein